jgi:hypothetical protein
MGDLETVPPPVRRGTIGGKEKDFRGCETFGNFEMKK